MAEFEARTTSHQQLSNLHQLTETPEFLNLTLPQLIVREGHSENAWNRFVANNSLIIAAATDAEETAIHRDLMNDVEQLYLQVRERLQTRIVEINVQFRRQAIANANERDKGQNNMRATTPFEYEHTNNQGESDYQSNIEEQDEIELPDNDLRELVSRSLIANDNASEHFSDYDYSPTARFTAQNPNPQLYQTRRNIYNDLQDEHVGNQQSTNPPVKKSVQQQEKPLAPSQVQLQPIYISCPSAGQMDNTWGEFDGNLTKWQTFHDCFKAAVHDNKSISNVFKFQRLKSSLKGKAANIFNGWEHTDANYNLAWERLKQIYQRKYQTSKQLFRTFFNLPSLDYASGAMLERLSNVTHTVLSQLRSLGYPVQHYDAIFLHTLHDKLDPSTSKEWELYRTSETPRLSTMLQFLDWQAKALSNVQFNEHRESKDNRKRAAPKPEHKMEKGARFNDDKPASSSKNVERNSCVLCKENHYLHRCSKFIKLNLTSRRKSVRDHALCYNCLRSTHMVKDCLVPPCRRCNKKHNSLLCPENPSNMAVTTVQKVKKNERKAKAEKSQ